MTKLVTVRSTTRLGAWTARIARSLAGRLYKAGPAASKYQIVDGFVLQARSEVNANPRDGKDHPHGVWSLPPTLRGGAADRERFLAIGESDRFTHRYVKPA